MASEKSCIWLNEKGEFCGKDVIEGSNFCGTHSPKMQSKDPWLEHTVGKQISEDDNPWINRSK